MVDAIEKIDSKKRRPVEYDYLFDIEQRIADNHDLEVEDIEEEMYRRSDEYYKGRKVAQMNSRRISQDHQTMTKEEQIKSMRDKQSMWFNSAGVVCQLGSAVFGQGKLGGIATALGQGCSTTASRIDQTNKSQEELHNHSYTRTGTVISDHSENARSSEQEYQQNHQALDKRLDRLQRLAEMICSGQ